jgi:histidine triad (HIT) family protein
MTDCLFCKIIAKEIPSHGVYEDDHVYAFLDIKPVNPGHTLVVPKKHSEEFLSADEEVLKKLIVAMQKVAKGVVMAMRAPGFNLEQNNGAVAGQVVPHLHFHIVPRSPDDGLKHWPGKPYMQGKDAEVAEKIRKSIG